MNDLYNPKRRQLAREYNKLKDRYGIYKLILKILFWVIFFGVSVEERIYQSLTGQVGLFDFRLLLFIIIIYFTYSIVMGIADYLLDYKLAREYNLSNQSSRDWIRDKLKMFILSSIFLYIIARAFLTFGNWYSNMWWLPFTFGGILFTAVINFIFPVVLFPLFFEVKSYPKNELRERLMALFDRANIAVDDIYQFNLSSKVNSANAAVMGMGKTRKIILGDNLEDKYSNAEIEAVLAHEIGHHDRGDIFKLLGLQFINLIIVTSLIAFFWPAVVSWVGYQSIFSMVSLPLFLILFGFINWLLKPLELVINRKLETEADEFALNLIEEPKDLGTAFAKLADESLSELQLGWYKLLFKASHPPIGERVEKALNWNKN